MSRLHNIFLTITIDFLICTCYNDYDAIGILESCLTNTTKISNFLTERYDKMKKVIAKTVALVALLGMISGSAMAAGPIEATKTDGVVTVKVSTLEAGEETSLLVTKDSAGIADAFADTTKVYHIDQVAANDEGVSTFTFSYTGTDPLTLYSGYATMSATDVPYDTVLDESVTPDPGPDDPVVPDPEFTYGDVNADADINVSDVTSVVDYVLNRTAFTKADGTAYEYGFSAADVTKNNVVDVSDVTSIVDYVLNRTPFPDAPAAE